MASRAGAAPMLWRDTVRAGARRSGALIGAGAILLGTLLATLALFSYHPTDPALNTAAGGPVRNLVGGAGAVVADLMLAFAGPATGMLLPLGAIFGIRLWRGVPLGLWARTLGVATLGVALIGTAIAFISSESVLTLPGGWGGIVGFVISEGLRWAIGFVPNAAAVLWIGRILGVVIGVSGAILWARALNLSLPERGPSLSLPRFGRAQPALTDQRAVFDDADPLAEPAPKPLPRK